MKNDLKPMSDLHESEMRYRRLFEAAQDGILILDADSGAITDANPFIKEILGYSRQDLIGKRLWEIGAFYDVVASKAAFKELLQKEYIRYENLPLQTKDGQIREVEFISNVYQVNLKKVIQCNIRNIAKRKEAEEALRESEVRYRCLFESAKDGILILDAETGKIIDANSFLLKILNYPQDEVIGKKLWEIGSFKKIIANQDTFRKLQHQEYVRYEHLLLQNKIGVTIHVEFISNFYLMNERKIIQCNIRDITERKRAEEKITQLAAIVQSSEDAIIGKSLDGIIMSWNKGAEKIYGYTESEVIDKSISLLIPPGNEDEMSGILNRIRSGEVLEHYETTRRRKDGQEIQMSLTISPIRNPESKIVAASTIGRDITKRKQAEQELIIANKELVFQNEEKEKRAAELIIANKELVFQNEEKEKRAAELIIANKELVFQNEERKRIEEVLATEQFLMNMLMDNIPDHIYFKDKESRFITMNKSHATKFGLSDPAGTIGKTDFDFFDEQHAQTAFEDEQKIMKTGQPLIGLEEKETWPDGSVTWVITTKMPLRDKEGEIIGTFGISKDITERKRAEDALRSINEKLIRAQHAAHIGSWEHCLSTDQMHWSDEMFNIMGFPISTSISLREVFRVFPPEELERFKEMVDAAVNSGVPYSMDYRIVRLDSTVRYIHDEGEVFLDEHGKAIWMFGTTQDITERKQMEEGLRQMQKLEGLGSLAGGIAHDFNNILGIILAYITSTKRFKDDTKNLDLAVNTIVKAVERGKTLVQQILTFARKTETVFGAVDVNDVVNEIMVMIFETFPKTLTYAQNFDKAVPCINADRSQLHQLLMNLCVNARDAMPKGGVLTINTHMVSGISLCHQHRDAVASSYVCIEVSDTGEGMSEETRNKIFEPFFTTKELGKGTGLGLAVVYGIVQSHKGFIDVESELRKGTTFSIYLPASQAAAPISVQDEKTLEEIPGGSETLLVVEDEEMLMMTLQTVLGEKGYKVLSAGDGLAAVNIYKERKKEIALVITDLGLPNISGVEECAQIRKINPYARIIVATGYLDPGMKSEFLKARIQHFLYKPYDLKQVLKEIREVLDKK